MRTRTWSKDDEELLQLGWEGGIPTKQIAADLGRTPKAVKSRAKKLGFCRPGRHVYTEVDRDFLRGHYASHGGAWCAEQIGVTRASVYQAAQRLGLTEDRPPLDYDHLDQFIRRHHAKGWSDQEISEAYRRRYGQSERHTIGDRRKVLGLGSNRDSDHYRRRVAANTRQQLRRSGFRTLADVRVDAWRRYAIQNGWPEDLRPRAVQILNALWHRGPMTRPEIAAAVGMPWKGSRKSLVSNDPEGSYLAHLIKRGLVVSLPRAHKVIGRGSGHSMNVYAIPTHVEKQPCDQRSA